MKQHSKTQVRAPGPSGGENPPAAREPAPPGQTVAEAGDPLHALLDNAPDAIYFKDRQSRFVHFSKSFREIFGVSDPEVVRGKTDFDFFTEEHARPAFDDEQEIVRTGKPIIGKLEKETRPNGRVTWALTTKMPWRDKAGNTIGIFGISKDITPLKEAEDKLANERELLRTLLHSIPDLIYFKDLQSRFLRVSKFKLEKSFELALGRHRASQAGPGDETPPPHLASLEHFARWLPGKTDFDLYPEERARSAYQDEQEIIRTGKPVVGKVEKTILPDGSVTWLLTSKMPWRDSDGNIIGTFGTSKDITPIKEAEAKVEVLHRQLVETSRLAGKAEVASDVLHNVGNALNSINVSCSLAIGALKALNFRNLARIPSLLKEHAGQLEEFLTTDPRGKRIPDYLVALPQKFEEQKNFLLRELGQLRQHIEHVNQIVALQQSYAKVAGLEESVEVAQLVEDALQVNAVALQRHTIRYRRDLEPLPPILVDKHKVLQILINLIRNAKYALDEAERPDKLLTLRVRRTADARVQIQVIDNGVGIPPENLTLIFAHGFTTRRNGHGFGLHSGALAARELGGALFAHSDGLGHGATFTLTLPFKPPPAA